MVNKRFLAELLNDERNSALFYSYLSTLFHTAEIRDILEETAVECGRNSHFLLAYIIKNGMTASEDFGSIEKNISAYDGLCWAVETEEKSIEYLSSLRHTPPYAKIYTNKKKRLTKLKRCLNLIDRQKQK